jgi:hypothetical protein
VVLRTRYAASDFDVAAELRLAGNVEPCILARQGRRQRDGATPLDLELLVHVLSPPSSENFMVSPLDVADIIKKMCAYDSAQRYPSMDGVLQDLSRGGD